MIRLLITLVLVLTAQKLAATLANGPMLGPIEMREAQVWVQTEGPSLIRIAYAESGDEQKLQWSPPVKTDSRNNNTATIHLGGVEPGRTYTYRVEVDGELVTDPTEFTTPAFYHGRTPPPDFTIAVGGAHYAVQEGFEPPYRILGADYNIFQTIAESNPTFMLWLGNTAHLRESDWGSKSGYLKRFTHARSLPEMDSLLSGTPNYAIWGASDYGAPNAGELYSQREYAESSFRAFWPQPAKVVAFEGLATRFRYADAEFFLLDTRSQRNDTPTSKQPFQVLGPKQIEWLRQELLRSTATFKVVCAGAPILNPAKSRSNLSYAEREQSSLLQMFRNEEIPGLFFLSGGKYYGELTRLVHASTYNLFDLTLGPLTAEPQENEDELNFFRMPGTRTLERQFALIDFTGSEEDRRITIRIMSVEGKELWNRNIPASQLKLSRD
ncbi:MAG: alkaline phosphatase D family protein [Verrucomicrobiota bacterium]